MFDSLPDPPFGVLGALSGGGGGGGVGVSDVSLEARRCAAAIGMLAAQHADFGARNAPALVIVPALALAGWAAEFARWAPELNVVEYCGSATSRHVVQEHEWSHRRAAKEAGIASIPFYSSSLSPSRCKESSPPSLDTIFQASVSSLSAHQNVRR